VIQEIVEHDDWCGGDALALFATWDKANTGRLRATSFEGDPAKAPTLEIEYESDLPDTTCRRLSLNRQVNNSGDDAHEASNGTVTVQSSNSDGISLSLHSSGGAGIRFGDLRIPGTAADIESAYLEVTASEDNSNSNTLKIYAQKGSSSPAEFTTQNKNISSRSLTTAQGTITSSKWNKGTVYRSDDIAPVIKEVLNSLNANSWVAGTSSLVFVVKANSTSNNRRVYSYDSGSSNRIKAPRLIITFKDRSREGLGRTTRDELIDQIDKLEANGNTPIQDTLYESVLYYSGREVDYGAYRGNPTYGRNRISNPLALQADTYTVSTPTGCTSANYNTDTCKAEKLVGAGGKQPTYKSPMNDNQQCLMTSNVILLTDGEANSANSTTKIKSLIGNQMSQLPSKATSNNATNCTVGSGGNACVRELVEWAHEFDIVPNEDTNFPYPINGIQTLKFYTIGFNIDDPLLEDIARLGGGQYSTVQNEVQLETTFDKYFGDSLETTSTFVAPVAAVNAFNRLFSLNDLYFAIFQPEKNRSWAGNLKKYKIRDDATIIDVNANAATANGKFVASAKSFWSNGTDDADGASVTKGGANAMVPNHADRKIYTFTGSYSGTTLGSGSFSLTAASNNLHSSNNNLTAATFNNPTLVSSYTDLIDWIRGKDVKNNSSANRHVIGDPIHSSPVAITYGGTESDPDIMLYLTTNTGFLHAINATTGVEQWAFLPQELLGVQEEFYENADSTSQHLYGLDGAITTWVRDNNIDGKLDPAAGDHAYLYFGMRRGGRNYYAIDVTNTTANTSDVSPKLKWVIRGGESPYTEMGESWAQPLRTKINLNGTVRDVLIISGGYDSNKDVQATRQEDTVGRAIYIVDANNGSLIWSGGPAETGFTKQFTSMKYSIPAAPAGVDMDLDGLIDQFYVGDMGGQVWRFDIKNGVTSAANLVSGGVIADLAADSSITNNRRFYQSPDIAIERNGKTNEKFLAVVLGSGWRENPLDAGTQDRFYRIDQYDMRNPPSSYVKYTEADLYDASTNVIGTATDESQRGAALELLSEAKGWYINFPNSGEKTMSSPLVYEGNVYFNTFEPKPPITNTCEAQAGTNRAYAVALATAAGANNWNNADASVLSEILPSLSLIDRPSLIFLPNKTIITRDPLEPEDTNKAPGGKPQKTYWREN
jgi:type IV pilus assembly protein PilY1